MEFIEGMGLQMNFFIHQNIVIHTLKIDGISNSAVLQVGTAGMIKPVSNLYDSGGFTQSAPSLIDIEGTEGLTQPDTAAMPPLVPLVGPSR